MFKRKEKKSFKSWGRPDITGPILKILEENKQVLHQHLSSSDRDRLSDIKLWLQSGCTGRPKPAIKNFDRLGQFVFLTFSLPHEEDN